MTRPICFWLCVLVSGSPAAEPEPALDLLSGYSHLSWTARDGAPSGIGALAQTSDRHLWLGTSLGLHRFDGFRFSSYPFHPKQQRLVSNDISALVADRKGGLWIGYRVGGISYLTNDGIQHFGAAEGLIYDSTEQLMHFADGSVWSVAGGRLWKFNGRTWENFGATHGLTSDGILAGFLDRQGTVWVSEHKRVHYLPAGARAFREFEAKTFRVSQFFERSGGELWVSDAWRSVHPLRESPDRQELRLKGVGAILVESDDAFWVAQDYKGVLRVSPSLQPQKFVKEDGLSSQETRAVVRDDDGNVWIGTSGGLDRFRPSLFHPFSQKPIQSFPAIATTKDGAVWIAALGEPLQWTNDSVVVSWTRKHGVSAMASDRRDGVWLYDFWSHALFHYKKGVEAERVPPPTEVGNATAQSIVCDKAGNVVAAFYGWGIWRYDGAWRSISTSPRMKGTTPLTLYASPEVDSIWLGHANNVIVELVDDTQRDTSLAPHAPVGNVLTFYERDGLLWVGGTEGVAVRMKGAFRKVTVSPESTLRGVSGIVQDNQGTLWLNGGSGVVRVSAAGLKEIGNSGDLRTFEVFDARYGLRGMPAQLRPLPSAIADGSGRLWFATAGSLTYLNPGAKGQKSAEPAVSIENVRLNNVAQGAVSLAAKYSELRELEIAYAAVELTSPERVQYRYKLNDEPVARFNNAEMRSVSYGRLPPGAYTFEVSASSGNGEWSQPARLQFIIQPAFYQTSWFYAVCSLALAGFVYLLYLARLRYVTGHMQNMMEERVQERLSIARHLHDTLLQTVQALTLRFHFAVEDMPEHEPSKAALSAVLIRAESAIDEARQHVHSLRADADAKADFSERLSLIAGELDEETSKKFHLRTEGVSVPLHSLIQDELCRIAKEAVRNAVRHACATSIELTLVYDRGALQLICSDNGKGIDADVLRAGGKTGHWGLAGMKERASAIGAEFSVESSPGEGTQVTLKIPGNRAYQRTSENSRWRSLLARLRS
jgi:ligand-binding sensor domain-containing protein/two-component sensor histidine kinase